MSEEIKVILSADASEMAAELQKAENELRRFQAELKKATDVTTIQTLQASITQLKSKIEVLGASQQKFARSSNTAAYALNDLSRIAQDAPYGFIGIQNNINPLLDSFQRLRAESKLTGNSLGKELVSALKGPAGLGLAVGVVSAAITFASVGFDRWVASSKAAKEATKDFSDSLRSAEQGAISQGIRLEGLVKIITDVSNSEKNRNLALDEANRLLKPYGEKIDSINISVKEGKRLTDLYTESLINQAVSAKYADKIAELRIKKQDNINAATLQQSVINGQAAQQSVNANKIVTNQFSRSDAAALNFLQTNKNLTDEQKKLNDIKAAGVSIQIELDRISGDYNATISKTLTQNQTEKKDAKDKVKDIQSIDDVLKKLTEDLRDQKALAITFDTSTLKEQANLIEQAITDLVTKFNLNPNDKQILKLQADLADINIELAYSKIQRRITNVPPLKIKVEPELKGEKFQQKLVNSNSFKQVGAYFDKQAADAQKKFADYQSIIVGLAQQSFEQIGTILGQGLFAAISGQSEGLKAAFSGLFQIFGDAVISLGKYAIEYSAFMVKLKASIAAGGGITGIALGIGLIALGTLIKAATANVGKVGGFAVGTRNAPGGMAMVGERGPELLNIPRGAQVVPAAQTAAMMGGMQSVEVFGMLRGQDIYFSNKKYGQTYNRQT